MDPLQVDKYTLKNLLPRKSLRLILGVCMTPIFMQLRVILLYMERKPFNNLKRAKLEETCVMVTGEDVHFVPRVDSKHRPDKNAFALRKRSARKQEYEQLALWYGDDEKSNLESGERLGHSPTVEETQKSPAHEFCESEWEIL
ncbi:uncharacterized protein LOC103945428 isoform X3 [Pyrus x bretschneideri]|uniref:uncharacterized protein LOC103945428 isoform X3 n=1 Tax=Pyrus x bretschneideri TaxID=225117 RepID=UPI00202E357B|nr:uncharacterized protein LOC103945428 isoform X3 [Pyrus x bretschneideri]